MFAQNNRSYLRSHFSVWIHTSFALDDSNFLLDRLGSCSIRDDRVVARVTHSSPYIPLNSLHRYRNRCDTCVGEGH